MVEPPIIHFAHPSLTAVVQPVAAVTARGVELLIADQGRPAVQRDPVSVPATLALRDSVASVR